MNRLEEKELLQEFLDYLSNNEMADIGSIQIDLFLDWKHGEVKNEGSGYEVRKAKNGDLCIMTKEYNIRIATFVRGASLDAEEIDKSLQMKG